MFFLSILLFFIVACSEDNIPDNRETNPTNESDVIENYAQNTFYAYKDSLVYGKILQKEISTFVENPNAESFSKVKKAWLDSRVIFSRAEMFSIHHELLEEHSALLEWINGSISPDIIDYTSDDNESGVINSPDRYRSIADFSEITRENLISLNRHDSEIGHVITGYHAIEFLLWGEDFNTDPSDRKSIHDRSMSGSRPVSDYITHKNTKRRAQYLKVVSALLVDGLSYITKEWDPNIEGGYDAYFKMHDKGEVMYSIYNNMINNIEYVLASERFSSVVRGGVEHSPFSDNSLSELRDNIHGLQFVYTGHYVDGSGRYYAGRGFRDYVSCYVGIEEANAIDQSYTALVAGLSPYIDRGDALDVSHSIEEIKSMDAGWFSSIFSFFKKAVHAVKAVVSKSPILSELAGQVKRIPIIKKLFFQVQPMAQVRGDSTYPPPASLDYYPTPQSAYSGSYLSGSYGPASERPGSYQPGSYESGSYKKSGEPSSGGDLYVPVYRPVIIQPNNHDC